MGVPDVDRPMEAEILDHVWSIARVRSLGIETHGPLVPARDQDQPELKASRLPFPRALNSTRGARLAHLAQEVAACIRRAGHKAERVTIFA
jgi:hypothetical protein